MRTDLSDITVVLDRSGSMQSCRTDAEGGLNHFIESQKSQAGDAVFSLVQFDTEYEFVHRAKPIAEVPRFTLEPRGGTALLDALGRAITETGQRLAAMHEADRPGLVVFVIITDGEENSSREYTLSKVRELITHQSDVYKWQFTYLGANQDAFAEAGAMGIAAGAAADFDTGEVAMCFSAASANVGRLRHAVKSRCRAVNEYTDEERAAMSK